jgi:two-component system response regulator AtoC
MHTGMIVLAEHEAGVATYLETVLRQEGYEVRVARHGGEVMACLSASDGNVAAVALDAMMPWPGGIETLRQLREANPHLPVLLLTGAASPQEVVEALRSEATEFVAQPLTPERLLNAVRMAAQEGAEGVEPFFCHNPQMRSVRSALKQIALADVPVILCGESGVGKEILAREIHALSPRAHKPFLKINCAALPQDLLESEMFGYERGAFTGAVKSTPGKFEATDGGVILLDEIGDLDIRLQAKLLHVLQDSAFQRLGGRETIHVNVRVLAATHCDLEKAIEEKRFREDLYYRLSVVSIQVPPLRERKDEILPFARLFLEKHATPGMRLPEITPALSKALLVYHWPGNVRELENVIRRLLVFRDADALAHEMFQKADRPALPMHAAVAQSPSGVSALQGVNEARRQEEAEIILNALTLTRWNRKKTAGLLKIDYRCLLYKMKSLGISHDETLHIVEAPQAAAAEGIPALDEVCAAKDQEEARIIINALTRTHWSRKRAAELLQVDYRRLLYRMKRLGIGLSQRPEGEGPSQPPPPKTAAAG